MNVTLEDAILIHARALTRRHGRRAPENAREFASARKMSGDHDGYEVWLRVAGVAERLLREMRELSDDRGGPGSARAGGLIVAPAER